MPLTDELIRSFKRGYALARLNFDMDRLDDCIEEAKSLLAEPDLPRYYQIKTYLLIAACVEDYVEAERLFERAQGVYGVERALHIEGEDAQIDLALDDCLNDINFFRGVLDKELNRLLSRPEPPLDLETGEPFIVDARGWPTPAELDPDIDDLEFYGYEGDTDSEDLAEAEREVFAAGDLSIAEYRAKLMEGLPSAPDEEASKDGSNDEEAEGTEQDVEPASAAPDLSTETSMAIEVTEELDSAAMGERATSPSQDTEMQAGPSHASVGRSGTLAIRNRLTGKQRMRRGQGKGEAPSSLRKLQQAFKGKDDEA